MSPLRKESVELETYTILQGERAGQKVRQITAQGTDETPGTYVFIANAPDRAEGIDVLPGGLIDIRVDRNSAKTISGKGIWKRVSNP